MKKIAIAIVDTYEDKFLPKLSLQKCMDAITPSNIYTFSNSPIIPGEKFYKINKIKSIIEYSDIVINILPSFIDEDYVIIAQWDGFAINPNLWDMDFLNYDYIGAPWFNKPQDKSIGNGGFSLRSKNFIDMGKNLKIDPFKNESHENSEDILLCDIHESQMRGQGIKYAPLSLALKFSCEFPFHEKSFGFHGSFNFPHVFDECFLLQNVHEIINRTSNINALFLLIANSLNANYNELIKLIDKILTGNADYSKIKVHPAIFSKLSEILIA